MKTLRFKRKYFELIQSKRKDLECRLNYPNLRTIKRGDKIKLFCENSSFVVKVIEMRFYKNFEDMLSKEGTERLIPGMNYQEALREYETIYPKSRVSKFGGLLVLEIKMI